MLEVLLQKNYYEQVSYVLSNYYYYYFCPKASCIFSKPRNIKQHDIFHLCLVKRSIYSPQPLNKVSVTALAFHTFTFFPLNPFGGLLSKLLIAGHQHTSSGHLTFGPSGC